ncbi:uncharacterized protein LOC135203771 [Macrobrachium nipponense]|uniref:uncharacterized protein LOC135203771 n=1 Tax=Macrobrachium nipponense TaxID=159736 RepID=UPI0030C7E3DF
MSSTSLLLVLSVLVASSQGLPATGRQSASLEKAFSHRPTIESIISCFVGKTQCSPEQQQIKSRALATMRNFGTCPDNVCRPQERIEMERAMELLQSQHPDLWAGLIFAVLGIDIKGF